MLHVVILAAGEGKRMNSALPKVLQPVGGRPMITHVLRTADALSPEKFHLVYGFEGEQLKSKLTVDGLNWVAQDRQLGTGHAVMQCLPDLPEEKRVLVVYGDTPLVPREDLERLLASEGDLALLTMRVDDPHGYGRILRDRQGGVTAIVEEKDASRSERLIDEVNSGILACGASHLHAYLHRLGNNNAQGEFYLTDLVGLMHEEGHRVDGVLSKDASLLLGANDRIQLATLERRCQELATLRLMKAGATLIDPQRCDVRGEVSVGNDVVIDINVVFEGEVILGNGVTIGPGCVIKDSALGDGVSVAAHSVIEGAVLEGDNAVGPFARVRPGTRLEKLAKIGNFVETKKAHIGRGSKLSHLSYIGDSEIGDNVNIGAGTITCNYDGVNKHQTVIEDGAFIGSNTALVAPVSVGSGATIGAGSVITKDTPPEQLTVARGRQLTIAGWKKPVRG